MKKLLLLFSAIFAVISCSPKGDGTVQFSSEADLSGHRVAARTGSCYDMDLSGRDDIELLLFNSEPDLLQALLSGHAEVLVDDETTYNSVVCKEYGIKVACKGERLFPTALMFRKEDRALVQAMNAVQQSMLEDGTMQAIKDYWLTEAYLADETFRHTPPVTEGKPLRVACVSNMAPIAFVVGNEWYGLEIELLYALSAYLHRPLDIKLYDASGLMALKNGTVDIMTGCMFVTEERKEQFAFSEPYHSFRPAYYVLDKDAVRAEPVGFWKGMKKSLQRNLVEEGRWKYITSGLLETVKISFFAILLGSVLGVGICAMARSKRKWLRNAAAVYSGFMAGIPILVLLLILFYVVFSGSGLSPSSVAIVAFALDFAAGAGGLYNTSLSAIPRGQTEAGLALGFTRLQTFFHIVFPQALKRGLPLFEGQCISLLKGTSIVGYVAIQDLTRAGDLIRSRTFDPFIPLLAITVIYFLLSWLIIALLKLAMPKKHVL